MTKIDCQQNINLCFSRSLQNQGYGVRSVNFLIDVFVGLVQIAYKILLHFSFTSRKERLHFLCLIGNQTRFLNWIVMKLGQTWFVTAIITQGKENQVRSFIGVFHFYCPLGYSLIFLTCATMVRDLTSLVTHSLRHSFSAIVELTSWMDVMVPRLAGRRSVIGTTRYFY